MDQRHTVKLQGGKDYALYSGALSEAHARGLRSIEVELVQLPAKENEYVAIARAKVEMKDGTVFIDFGDASPKNTAARTQTALIRVACTRAKGRALRDAVNIGQTLLEEL